MKIAVITEDGQTISQHFGRAPYYQVFTIADGQIVSKELRDKVGHRQFAEEPHDHEAENDPRGHGFGAHSDAKHARMVEAITDCEANIRPFVTDFADAEEAVQAYLDGKLADHSEWLH